MGLSSQPLREAEAEGQQLKGQTELQSEFKARLG